MNPIIKFYQLVFSYLQSDFDDPVLAQKIVEFSKEAKPSWSTTIARLEFLEQCCNRGSSVENDEHWSETTVDFAKAAFRDLSVIKNPLAMELFWKIANKYVPTFGNGEDFFVWARNVKVRPDGSAVILLHVTDLERFRELIEEHDLVDTSTQVGTLEHVVQIGS